MVREVGTVRLRLVVDGEVEAPLYVLEFLADAGKFDITGTKRDLLAKLDEAREVVLALP